jgi:hypothetical protein
MPYGAWSGRFTFYRIDKAITFVENGVDIRWLVDSMRTDNQLLHRVRDGEAVGSTGGGEGI